MSAAFLIPVNFFLAGSETSFLLILTRGKVIIKTKYRNFSGFPAAGKGYESAGVLRADSRSDYRKKTESSSFSTCCMGICPWNEHRVGISCCNQQYLSCRGRPLGQYTRHDPRHAHNAPDQPELCLYDELLSGGRRGVCLFPGGFWA